MISIMQQRMYTNVPNLIIGFHGCDQTTMHNIINGKAQLKQSRNKYDWLGHGMYFWEQNLQRAWQWANDQSKRKGSNIKVPAVLGAVIDLGYCLNLLDSRSIEVLKNNTKFLSKNVQLWARLFPKIKIWEIIRICFSVIWIVRLFSICINSETTARYRRLIPYEDYFLKVTKYIQQQVSEKRHIYKYVSEIQIA